MIAAGGIDQADAAAIADRVATLDRVADAVTAAALLSINPIGLGGVVIRGQPGPIRDRWLAHLRSLLEDGTPFRRVPAHVSDDRLLGGLDLTSTLKAGRPVRERGLLAAADGGFLLLAMAERLRATAAGVIAAAMDKGEVRLERDGFEAVEKSRFAVIAFDESLDDEDRPSALLRERLAFDIDLGGIALGDWSAAAKPADAIDKARERLVSITVDDDLIEAMTGTALALGIASLRAPLFAVRAAAAAAALDGRTSVDSEDAVLAVRLTLAHRTTRLPEIPDEDDEPAPEDEPDDRPADEENGEAVDRPLEDRLLAAAAAALPPGLLASLRQATVRQGPAGRAAATRKSGVRGRPAGFRPGRPRGHQRLNVIETLRAAAPWQPIRRRRFERSPGRIIVQPDDLRLVRRKEQSRTTTIFVVDASGSSALERLAEAKGAVELLLAECYTRRDQVALIAFRGEGAELLLPPTRSLARAKRSLAALPGGGGTPLAAGIETAALLADGARRRGETPLLVFLTDGRANIARDGTPGRKEAHRDAKAAARHVAVAGDGALVIDISARPGAEAATLAEALNARYLPLPKADARYLSDMVASARSG